MKSNHVIRGETRKAPHVLNTEEFEVLKTKELKNRGTGVSTGSVVDFEERSGPKQDE